MPNAGRKSREMLHADLYTSIECVLLDHADELDAADPDTADPNMIELAIAYQRVTGWTVAEETGREP